MKFTRALIACFMLAATLGAGSSGAAGRCGAHAWCDDSLDPDTRASMVLEQMTREEKFELMAGDDPAGVFTGEPAIGFSRGIPRLGIPDLHFNDGPAGLRAVPGGSTGLPSPAALAATFNDDAAARFGQVLGVEATKRRIDVVLSPMLNIVRYPGSGRSFETFGEDPHLASRLAVAQVRAIQAQGPMADPKHFAANNQEINRFTVSADVDERTLREIYLPAFEAAVTEGEAATVMLAYNRVNGTHMTEHGPLVNGVLKGEWGFRGIALSDWGLAQRSTVAAANNGNDLEMPMRFFYSPTMLGAAVDSGQVSMATIDEHVHRILRTMFAYGVFDREAYPRNGTIDVEAHAEIAHDIAVEGMTLLRNQGALPLSVAPGSTIAVIGPDADNYVKGGGSSAVEPFRTVTPLQGITARAEQAGASVVFDDASDLTRAMSVAGAADVAIVVAADPATEFADRACLSMRCTPGEQDEDEMIARVAAANPNTIVVLETSSAVLMPWIEDVAAIVQAWYPGQEGGRAIASVLFGDEEPGGRLPVTFPAREQDTPFYGHPERWPGVAERAAYSEGVFVGYRWYDEQGITPLFPFGFGLGYTTFRYRNMTLTDHGDGVTVSLLVRNEGTRTGSTVPQLYVVKPGAEQPPRSLVGMRRVRLAPGESTTVTFELDERALSTWDTATGSWKIEPGCYDVLASSSSRDVHLRRRFVRGDACA